MKKPIVRALIVGIIFVFVFYAFQIIQGIYLTIHYVPDIVKSYESVDNLQNKVTFGYTSSPIWRVLEILGLILLGIIVFYIGRVMRRII